MCVFTRDFAAQLELLGTTGHYCCLRVSWPFSLLGVFSPQVVAKEGILGDVDAAQVAADGYGSYILTEGGAIVSRIAIPNRES